MVQWNAFSRHALSCKLTCKFHGVLVSLLPCRAGVHGQVAKELAEPYYLYGRALLDVAR